MTKKKLWIFGDSWAEPEPTFEYVYTERLNKDYDVLNLAQGGTSIDWSINEFLGAIKTLDTNNVYVLFFITNPERQYWTFFENDSEHFLAGHLADGNWWRKKQHHLGHLLKKYRYYRSFVTTFWRYIHPNWREITLKKSIAFINLYARLFKKVLIIPCFDNIELEVMPDKRVTLHNIAMHNVYKSIDVKGWDPRPNHMDEQGHDDMYRKIVEWMEKSV